MTNTKMTAQTWIEAAFRALSAGGPDAIRAEKIARDLKVSKGSFYWHFKNVDALKGAMLELWKSASTETIVTALEAQDQDAEQKLQALIEHASSDASQPYGGVIVEAAIRDWGRYDERVAAIVAQVDQQRLDYLDQLFAECGAKGSKIRQASLQFYSALIGLEALAISGFADVQGDLKQVLKNLLNNL